MPANCSLTTTLQYSTKEGKQPSTLTFFENGCRTSTLDQNNVKRVDYRSLPGKMRCCKNLDLSICGLLITTTLFLFPAITFLIIAFECADKMYSAGGRNNNSNSCARMDRKTVVILFVFGFLFLLVGILVCGFAFLIHRTNGKEKQQESSKS